MAEQTASLQQIIENLKLSPLFNLSLSSKELFHSNFLAWLCKMYPESVGRVFADFLKSSPASCVGLKVYREQRNIDLTLEYSDGQLLIVENKVKSIPSLKQLEEYSAEFRGNSQASFLLLSLTQPSFLDAGFSTITLANGTIWRHISYRDLADMLQTVSDRILSASNYHGSMLNDYIHFIQRLINYNHCSLLIGMTKARIFSVLTMIFVG